MQKKFYGTGENFLYTFKTDNKPIVYSWTGADDQMQWGNDKAIGIGGGVNGRFGIYVTDDFLKGSSNCSNTFNNEVLSSERDFICANLEVWGID